MSDTATATEAAPIETPAAPAPATPAAAPEGQAPAPAPAPQSPLSRRDAARTAARARGGEVAQAFSASRAAESAAPESAPLSAAPEGVATDTAPEVVVDEKGRKHDPATGQFLPESGETAANPDAPAADTRAAETQPDPKPAERAKGITVPISPDHPIRGMGLDAFTASTPAEEQAIRALLNGTYARRQEVEALQAQVAEERRLRIQLESSQAATTKWQQTPEYKAAAERYNEIADTVGEDAALAYWKGIQSDLQALQESEFNERWGAVEQEQNAAAGQQWASEAWRNTEAMPAEIRTLPEFQHWFRDELTLFDTRVERGHYDHLRDASRPHEFGAVLQREFANLLRRRIVSEPAAAAVIRRLNAPPAAPAQPAAPAPSAEEQARREAEIRRQAVEDFKRQAAGTRAATPPHPMGSLAHQSSDGRAVVPGQDEVDVSNLSPEQRRRHFRQQARGIGRVHFNQ
jgi:hypothetical protein